MAEDTEAEARALPPEINQGLDRLEAQAGAEPEHGAPAQPAAVIESWRPAVEWGFNLVKELAPGWNWTPTASRMFVSGGTDLMNRYFPGGPGAWETWGPWAKLLAALGVFGGANVANLKAMHKRLKEQKNGRKADGGDGAHAQRQDAEHSARGEGGTAVAGVRSEGQVGGA